MRQVVSRKSRPPREVPSKAVCLRGLRVRISLALPRSQSVSRREFVICGSSAALPFRPRFRDLALSPSLRERPGSASIRMAFKFVEFNPNERIVVT
jgi:hypothetical protein